MAHKFYGRQSELESFDTLWNKKVGSLVAVRGRRRIGKSTFVGEFARRSGARFICIDGLAPRKGMTNGEQLANFVASLARQSRMPEVSVDSWSKAFGLLDSVIDDNERTVVLLDEISWMGGWDPDFAGALKSAWDNLFKKHDRLVLAVCGSVSAWIARNILDNTGFVGRFSRDLILEELRLPDCVAFWGRRAARLASREIVDVLSVTGGVPRYLEEIDPTLSAEENIRRMCFSPDGALFKDFPAIFNSVFGERAEQKLAIMRYLANGARTVDELAEGLKVERGGSLTESLRVLELAGFLAADSGLNPATGKPAKSAKWRLKDNYTRFYLKYIEPRQVQIVKRGFDMMSLADLPGWNTVMGLQFENLVLNNYAALLSALHLDKVPVLSAAPWRTKGRGRGEGVQIDLLIQTRRSVCVVEVKRRAEIGEEVEAEVAAKIEKLKLMKGMSVRTALVYDGQLAPVVRGNAYFDALISSRQLLGEAVSCRTGRSGFQGEAVSCRIGRSGFQPL